MLLNTNLTPATSDLDAAAQFPSNKYARQVYARILSRENRFAWEDRVDWKVLRVVDVGSMRWCGWLFCVNSIKSINKYDRDFGPSFRVLFGH